jgi:hypothetical protein
MIPGVKFICNKFSGIILFAVQGLVGNVSNVGNGGNVLVGNAQMISWSLRSSRKV